MLVNAALKVMNMHLRSAIKPLISLGVLAVVAVLAYYVILGWMIFISPLNYREMDFNNDGQVSFGEADYASSFGERKIDKNGLKCMEYFAYKDGLPLKVIC